MPRGRPAPRSTRAQFARRPRVTERLLADGSVSMSSRILPPGRVPFGAPSADPETSSIEASRARSGPSQKTS